MSTFIIILTIITLKIITIEIEITVRYRMSKCHKQHFKANFKHRENWITCYERNQCQQVHFIFTRYEVAGQWPSRRKI